MKNILRQLALFMALSICLTLTGCFQNFYTVKSNAGFENLDTLTQKGDKKIVVHYADTIVTLSSPVIDTEKITGKITPYAPARPNYAEPRAGYRLQQYKYKHRNTLFNEVHVYANIPKPGNTELALIRKDEVVKYNTYKPAKGASTGSHILGGVLLVASIAFLAGMGALIAGGGGIIY